MKNDEIDHVAESYRAELRQLIERVKKYADDDLIVNMLAARRTGIEKKLMELNALRSGPPKPETFPSPTPRDEAVEGMAKMLENCSTLLGSLPLAAFGAADILAQVTMTLVKSKRALAAYRAQVTKEGV